MERPITHPQATIAAADGSAHARRLDTPHPRAYATSYRRVQGLTNSPRNLPENLDLEIAFGRDLFQPGVVVREVPQPSDVHRFQRPEPLPPGTHRLLTGAVLLRHLRHGPSVGFPQDRDHL